jgi:phosphocarrier protein HPr
VSPRASGSFEIRNARGLHARAATKLVKAASSYPCEVMVSSPDAEPVNAKSVMGVLLLCGAKGTIIEVVAEGDGAEEAVRAIGKLVDERFGEDE